MFIDGLIDNCELPTFVDDDNEEKTDEVSEKKGKYAKFWKEFGKAIKLGIIEDTSNRVRLAKLLRFHRYYIYFNCVFAECGSFLSFGSMH